MKKQLLTIFCCMLLITSSFIIIFEIDIKAYGENQENSKYLDASYIWSISDNLSRIVNNSYDSEDINNHVVEGRFFGTKGERDAATYLAGLMNELGLVNPQSYKEDYDATHPYQEKINDDTLDQSLDIVSEGLYIDGKKITDFYIAPQWGDKFKPLDLDFDKKNQLTQNVSYMDQDLEIRLAPPFPYLTRMFNKQFVNECLQAELSGVIYNESTFYDFMTEKFEEKYDFTFDDFNASDPDTYPTFLRGFSPPPFRAPFVFLLEDTNFNENYSFPPLIKKLSPLEPIKLFFQKVLLSFQMKIWERWEPSCKGVLKFNFDWNTYNMQYCYLSRIPVISVNRSTAWDIYTTMPPADLPSPDHHVRYWINQKYNWSAISYNVIGQINGSSNLEVLIDCLYDSWWNQGTADSAIGTSIVLAIAKYFKDHNIIPKYTLKFVAFSGEEFNKNGARYYRYNDKDNLITMIDLNQLGFSQTGRLPQTFFIVTNHPFTNPYLSDAVKSIANETNYCSRSGTPYLSFWKMLNGGPSDTTEFANDLLIDTILFVKDTNWTLHHRDGINHTKGDTMTYYDANDVAVTGEMIWNVTKYFTLWPDCRFMEQPTGFTKDSLNDNDNLPDTVQATIALKSILPSDRVRVKASLIKRWSIIPSVTTIQDFTITNTTTYHTLNITLPPGSYPGYYHLRLELLNSTERINDIIQSSGLANDTKWILNIHLYPRGNQAPDNPNPIYGDSSLTIGQQGSWSAPTRDNNWDLVDEMWYMDFDHSSVHHLVGPLYNASSMVPLMFHSYGETGIYKIRVKAYDQYMAMSGFSNEKEVSVTPHSHISPTQQTHSGNGLHLVQGETLFMGNQVGCQGPAQFHWSFGDRGEALTQNAAHTYSTGNYKVFLNVTDPTTSLIGSSCVNIRVTALDADFTSNCYYGTEPNATIQFHDRSRAISGIKNITWNFGDGNTSTESNPTHAYYQDGDYNVTITVTDNDNNVDMDYYIIHIKTAPDFPAIPYNQSPGIIYPHENATILAEIAPTDRNISNITLKITNPNGSIFNTTMTNLDGYVYTYTLINPTQSGNYTYTIQVSDTDNQTNISIGKFTLQQPEINFEYPTPEANALLEKPWIHINTSILDPYPTASFIDWNESLKGYWSMDSYNNTYINDSSPYLNFGTYHGNINASNITIGTHGKALNFDANGGYIDLGNDSSLNLGTGDFTFAIWIKSHATSYPGTAVILSNQPENTGWNGYILGVSNTPYIATMEDGVNTTLTGTVDVTDNTWHHIAYVRQGGILKLYIDGVPDGTATGSTQDITNDQTTCLDRGNSSDLCQFNGVLDEAILFNRALSWDEINTTINSTALPPNHNYTGLDDGNYTFAAYAIDTTGNQSMTETRQVTIDTHAPIITGVTATPYTIGLGSNVTIQATVTDATSGVNSVRAIITGPNYGDQLHLNETMTHTTGTTYQYIFHDSNKVGTYNYAIYTVDNASNSIIQSGHSFTVSATASISVGTLKDTYTNSNEYINLTDPPEIPENYTLIGQGTTWNKYQAPDGDHTVLETSTTPINYQNLTGIWNPINQTIRTLNFNDLAYGYGYRAGNERGLYSTYFKPNLQDSWPFAFAYNSSQDPTIHTVRTKLVGVGYLDPTSNWDYHILQNIQNSQGQINGNTVTYPGAFTGTDLTLGYGTQELKEALTMNNATKAVLQSHPPSLYGLNDASSYLVFITKVKAQNLALYNTTEEITDNITLTSNGIDFKTALEEFKCAMPHGEAYELNNATIRYGLTLRVIHHNGETYILAGLKLSDLATMTFPVVIDPSLTIYSSSRDGSITAANTNYNTAWSATTGTVDDKSTSIYIGQRPPSGSSIYIINRGFLVFDTTQIPSNAVIDSATLGLYKVSDYSTTDFNIVVQNGQPNHPQLPLAAGDYYKAFYAGNGGSLNTASFTTGYNDIALNSQGLSWIMPKDNTKLCLRSSNDIAGTTPRFNEYVTITSNEFTGIGCQPRLVIEYRNQSKIKNTGTTNIKGYLLMQVQYHTVSGWVLDTEVINETSPRTILANHQLGLDTIFNGLVHVLDLTHGSGTYRIYVAFRDPNGNVLMIDASHKLEATWQFTVSTTG